MATSTKHFTPKQRAAFLKEFHASGLTQIAFSKGKPFSYNTLNAWVKKEKKAKDAAKASSKLNRTTQKNGRFVEAAGGGEVSAGMVAPRSASVEQLGESELRQLVRLQAQVLARYI